MGTTIAITNIQKRIPLNSQHLNRIAQRILKFLKVADAHISFVFVSHQRMQAFHQKYLKISTSTDVLTFDLSVQSPFKGKKNKILQADIIICADIAKRQASLWGHSLQEEIVLYMAHGMLHLLGYDDHCESDIKTMRLQEKRVMDFLRKSSLSHDY